MTCEVPDCDGPEDYLIHDPTGMDSGEWWICGYHLDFLMGTYDERHPDPKAGR
ncbi:MAG: hypothetical protein ABEI52_00865 [Halobacteriaceae archaeon]